MGFYANAHKSVLAINDVIPTKILFGFNFLHSKRLFQNSVVPELQFRVFCVSYANDTERFTK